MSRGDGLFELEREQPETFGLLVINADDWGRDRANTQAILECMLPGAVSSASGMVFMEDSERAATVAHDHRLDIGLHLNLTTPFTAPGVSDRLMEHQRRLSQYLRRHRLAQVCFHPGLSGSFEYVVNAQLEEYLKLYGSTPDRIDGHHHMHLSANVRLQKLLPAGSLVRRNFSFERGEKGVVNRLYRRLIDRSLRRRHRLMDFLFALAPIEPASRLESIIRLASQFRVEVETHPVNPGEHRFLAGGEVFRLLGDCRIASSFVSSRV